MTVKKLKLNASGFLSPLRDIPAPPKELYVRGEIDALAGLPVVAIVGARKVTPYGRSVTSRLAGELAGLGVTIVSGLALGVDSIAHQAALDAGGKTVAVLPSGLDKIYPGSHHHLAENIVKAGGALITEYPAGTEPFRTNFIARNRLIAGLGQGIIITEAALKSGSLHTARFALEQGRTVMAVPGNITSEMSAGANNLLKAGATMVTSSNDVLDALELEPANLQRGGARADNAEEAVIIDLLSRGVHDGGELLARSGLGTETFNQTLTMLEITGRIKPLGAGQWTLCY